MMPPVRSHFPLLRDQYNKQLPCRLSKIVDEIGILGVVAACWRFMYWPSPRGVVRISKLWIRGHGLCVFGVSRTL